MLKYLVVLLDEASVPYCHYSVPLSRKSGPISVPILEKGILFALKENLSIQFVYPQSGDISLELRRLVDSVNHVKIVSSSYPEDADVYVLDEMQTLSILQYKDDVSYVLRIGKDELFANAKLLFDVIGKIMRLNVCITDIQDFRQPDFHQYELFLKELSSVVRDIYTNGGKPQVNLLTDRLSLEEMNNCNAGYESITLAPDGQFYACPAFYYEGEEVLGTIGEGLDIKNPQLYQLKCAPICRICDAYHCHRCVWLNKKMTFELNTPSHEQCVLAHLERNASRDLMASLIKEGYSFPGKKIKKIRYLDPLDKLIG